MVAKSRAMLLASPIMAALLGAAPIGQQITIPDRPDKSVFQGQQGESRSSELQFDPETRMVTLKLSVQDSNGYFVPSLRRHNFAVFENGIRQGNVTAEVEHAPITVAVLAEMGGRSYQWNKRLGTDVAFMIRPLLDVLGRDDRLAVFAYNGTVQTIVDFDTPHDKWDDALDALSAPQFSEANFYDAAVHVLQRLRAAPGRKALLLVTTGLDTFSHATLDDVLREAARASTPAYTIALGNLARHTTLDSETGPLARVDWAHLNQTLARLARVSGGRTYMDASSVRMEAIYDDIMENLRVRYVLTYVSTAPPTETTPRAVEVRLVDATSGEPLRIVDTSGRRVAARVLFQANYVPSTTAAAVLTRGQVE